LKLSLQEEYRYRTGVPDSTRRLQDEKKFGTHSEEKEGMVDNSKLSNLASGWLLLE
jgi:hypothetical protein